MTGLPDDRYLYEINIPGAHDAATASVWHEEIDYLAYDVEPYLEPFAKAQDKSIEDQLDSGVRALDLRLTNWIDGTREKDGVLILAHGNDSNGFCFRCMERLDLLTLTKVLDEVTAFLDEHPTETVILKVKEEYDDGKHKPVWGSIKSTIQDYDKSTGGKKLYIEDRWPTLGEVRGKAVICSDDKNSLGLDVIQISTGNEQTTTDCSKTDTIDPVHLYYENHWSVGGSDKKTYVNQFLDTIKGTLGRRGEAHLDTAGLLYSSSNLITTDVDKILDDIIMFIIRGYMPDDWQPPRDIADTVNPALHDRVATMPSGKYFGIVLADFCGRSFRGYLAIELSES